MDIIKLNDDKYIFVNGLNATVYSIADLTQRIQQAEERIQASPKPTDDELLEWARENYKFVDHTKEIEEVERLNSILEQINGN
jgi:hypothetical protein